MTRFYNPYQFIPVTGTIDGERPRVPFAAVKSGAHPTARHDLWHMDGLSGRILCSLYLETPTVIGAQQVAVPGSQLTQVKPYRWRDRYAIPGNTLKGMIAAVVEALSQSTLRVLDQHLDKTVGMPVDGSWRPEPCPVKVGTHEYFRRIDNDLVPWRRYAGRKQRNDLTPAELLFGVVEDLEQGVTTESARNLAGRVRFYDALPTVGEGALLPAVTLRILASPYLSGTEKAGKLCVPLYFHKRGERGGYIGKRAFYDADRNDDLLPNGRKVYLHHPYPVAPNQPDWQAPADYDRKTDKQRLRCTPLAAGQTFHFHLDFENLSRAELTLLERALAPAPNFQHRLGLGKPLGLGSVTLTVEGVFRIDRGARYAADAFDQPGSRYSEVWRPVQSPQAERRQNAFEARYPLESAMLGTPPPGAKSADYPGAKPADYEDATLIDPDTLAVVCALGNPRRLAPDLPVRTPFTTAQDPRKEGKSYEWFNDNDRHGQQALQPVPTDGGTLLPPLYASYQDANRSGVFFNAEVGEVADDQPMEAATPADNEAEAWLDAALDGLDAGPQQERRIEKLRGRELANKVVAITDSGLRSRVFAVIVGRCQRHGCLLYSPADKIYRKAGLVAIYV